MTKEKEVQINLPKETWKTIYLMAKYLIYSEEYSDCITKAFCTLIEKLEEKKVKRGI